MVVCPECNNDCDNEGIDSNAILCPTCRRVVYLIRDPRDPSRFYAAISNSDELLVSHRVLSGKMLDQSPTNEPPRQMIIEVDGGLACVVVLCKSLVRPRRKDLEKTAHAFRRDVILVSLPDELMSYIRSGKQSAENG